MEITKSGQELNKSQKAAVLKDKCFLRIAKAAETSGESSEMLVYGSGVSEYCSIIDVYIRIGTDFHYWAEVGKRGKIFSSKGEIS